MKNTQLASLSGLSALAAIGLFAATLANTAQAAVECTGGQTCTQTIQLQPGWNSVFLQVTPTEDATSSVFADFLDADGPQLSSVWTWLANRATVDFIDNPDRETLLSQPGWLRYFPESAPQAFLTNLFAVQGNRAYLLNLAGTEPATLSISGTPVAPRAQWEPNSYNLTGFHIDPANRPLFVDFLASSPAHKDQAIYRLENNQWQQVEPLTESIEADTAYWVYTNGGSDFVGPIDIELPGLRQFNYGDSITELSARFNNRLAAAQNITVQLIGGAAGLLYADQNIPVPTTWLALAGELAQSVPAEGSLRLRLGMRRAGFRPGEFNQVLAITSGTGSRWLVPVTAQAKPLNSLWVASVAVTHVSQVQNYEKNCPELTAAQLGNRKLEYAAGGSGFAFCYAFNCDEQGNVPSAGAQSATLNNNRCAVPVLPEAVSNVGLTANDASNRASGQFPLRFILLRETDGNNTPTGLRLLKEAIIMRTAASTASGSDELAAEDLVLLVDEQLAASDSFEGVAVRGGKLVGKRISSIAYDFTDNSDIANTLTPTAGSAVNFANSETFSFLLELAATAPSNPFRHLHHPSHRKASDSLVVKRTITFQLDSFPATLSPDSGDTSKAGRYFEIVEGLHQRPIVAAGRFELLHTLSVHKVTTTAPAAQ